MARMNRREVVAEDLPGMYHCVNRCVRRAFLCGRDAVSGQDFDHRKQWIRRRLEFLAGQFGIDVCGYTVMSNHLHVVLRNRPDVVGRWSDLEVARRWWNLFPSRLDEQGRPAEPEKHELAMLTADAESLAEIRRRLSSLSWFMRCLAEPIARMANREDQCKGRFWEGRFKCQALLDEAAVLACSMYVDLNPIRAAVAATPETSEFTSAHDRIHSRQERQTRPKRRLASDATHDGWLSPIELEPSRGRAKQQPPASKSRQPAKHDSPPRRRASDKGFLPLSLDEYLSLLDWTGRQARRDKRGKMPDALAPILDRLQIAGDAWVDTVLHFGRWFHQAVGRAESLAKEAARRGRRWMHGIAHSHTAFT